MPYFIAGKIQRHLRAKGVPIHQQQNQKRAKEKIGRQFGLERQRQGRRKQQLDQQPPPGEPIKITEGGSEKAA